MLSTKKMLSFITDNTWLLFVVKNVIKKKNILNKIEMLFELRVYKYKIQIADIICCISEDRDEAELGLIFVQFL